MGKHIGMWIIYISQDKEDKDTLQYNQHKTITACLKL